MYKKKITFGKASPSVPLPPSAPAAPPPDTPCLFRVKTTAPPVPPLPPLSRTQKKNPPPNSGSGIFSVPIQMWMALVRVTARAPGPMWQATDRDRGSMWMS